MVRKCVRIVLPAILLSLPSVVFAQSYAESALLFSRTQPTGSARIQALGGAQISLGGDYSSILSNPAGLGMYNRSEFTFSPALTFYSTEATMNGTGNTENLSKFNFPGLSYVLHLPKDGDSFLGGSFGVSMSRINDFNGSTIYRGHNETSSIVDYFLERANGDNTSQFDSYQYNNPVGLAYYNYLIGPQSILDPPGPDDQYFTDVPVESDQQEEISTKGTSYQWSFSYGANYKDVLFFGGGLGLTTLRYKSQKIYSEVYDSDIIESMNLIENLDLRGSGINVTLGIIGRPVDFIQVGLSFTSPTYYQISEKYDATMNSSWKNYNYWDGEKFTRLNDESASTDVVASDYNLTTPLKLSAGVTFISKFGFLSVDVERTNPAKAKYTSDVDGISFNSDNEDIRDLYQPVMNYRVGAELRYEIYRLRAGYNVQGSAFADNSLNNKIETISGGVGVKMEKFSIDFALVNRTADSYYSPYTLSDGKEPIVSLKNKITTGVITVGFSF